MRSSLSSWDCRWNTGTSSLITAPTDPALMVDEAKSLLGITDSSQDDMIEAAIDAVAGQLDAASGGWLGRALRPQTWEFRLSEFPCSTDEIALPYPVVTAVESVKYDDANGVEQTLVDGTDYRVFGLADYTPSARTRLWPVYNGAWASARFDVESVRIRYTSGYAAEPDDLLPQPIKQAIALGVRHLVAMGKRDLFEAERVVDGVGSRRWTVSESAGKVIDDAMRSLLARYWVIGG